MYWWTHWQFFHIATCFYVYLIEVYGTLTLVQHMTNCSFCYRKFQFWFPQTMVWSPLWQLGSKWPYYQRNWVADHLGLLIYVFSYKLTSRSGFPTALQYGIKCWYQIRALEIFNCYTHTHALQSECTIYP